MIKKVYKKNTFFEGLNFGSSFLSLYSRSLLLIFIAPLYLVFDFGAGICIIELRQVASSEVAKLVNPNKVNNYNFHNGFKENQYPNLYRTYNHGILPK